MITCPACGKENDDSAFECKRCRAPLHEDAEHHHEAHAEAPAEAAPAEPQASSDLGTVCPRCEVFNEPGVRICSACGYDLFASALEEVTASGGQPPLDKTPPQAFAPEHVESEPAPDATPPDGQPSISAELSALALSDEEAAEAGMSGGNGAQAHPMDRTPPQPYAAEPEPEPEMPAAPPPRKAEVAAAPGGGAAVSRRAPEPPPPAPPAARPAPEPSAAPAEKVCSNCGASNPPAAKFCFDCGTPFAKKAPAPAAAPEPAKPAPEPARAAAPVLPVMPVKPAKPVAPPSIHVDSSIHVDEELGAHDITDSTAESAPVSVDEPQELPAEEAVPEEAPAAEAEAEAEAVPEVEELPAEEAMAAEEAPAEEEPVPAEAVAEAIEEEPPAPFPASLVVEKGNAQGTAFALAHMVNTIGGSGAAVELAEDAFVAPHAATLIFADDHLAVRDEGSANGVFVKLRDPAPLQAGDLFIAGERLFRFDGFTDLPRDGEEGRQAAETPFLGAPRPQANAVRIVEVLAGGKTGRTCHRSGPVITIGRTGCDMNFPADGQLAAKHAEVRLGDDGSATLADLGQGPTGVWLRLRAQTEHPLQAGDLLQIGEQQLRVDLG